MNTIDAAIQIETPESAVLSFRLAGPGTRACAYFIDVLLRLAIFFGVSQVLGALDIIPFLGDLSGGVMLVLWFSLDWGYSCLFEGLWRGRTPGKHLLGLRVIKEGGTSITFFDALLRNLLRAADNPLMITFGVGLLVMMATRKLQRIGDIVAGTVVVREMPSKLSREYQLPFEVEPLPLGELERAYRPGDRVIGLIHRLFRRWGASGQPRQQEIALILALPLARKMGYTGSEEEVRQDPTHFLLRVYRTFAMRESSEVGKATRLEVGVSREVA